MTMEAPTTLAKLQSAWGAEGDVRGRAFPSLLRFGAQRPRTQFASLATVKQLGSCLGRGRSYMTERRSDPPNTLSAALERAGMGTSGLTFRTARGDARVLYREVQQASVACARMLLRSGYQATRVVLLLDTSPHFVAWYFGVLLSGGTPVPLQPPSTLGDVDEYVSGLRAKVQTVAAKVVIADLSRASWLSARAQEVKVEVWDQAAYMNGATPAGAVPLPSVSPHDIALVQFSSGTTASPKAVPLTHTHILTNVRSIVDKLLTEQTPGDEFPLRGVSWLPLHHDMGLIGFLFSAVVHEAELMLLSPESFAREPSCWLQAISDFQATISGGPNFAYNHCTENVSLTSMPQLALGSWRVAFTGAEMVCAETLRKFAARFAPVGFRSRAFTPVYGLSEATLFVTGTRTDEEPKVVCFSGTRLAEGVAEVADPLTADAREMVSVGKPVAGTSCVIRDAAGAPLGEGRVGALWVRGPSLMSGYEGADVGAVLVDGWLRTGDLAFVHAGEIYFAGRHDERIVIRGRNYSPEAIEFALDRLEGVRKGRCLASSIFDPQRGTEVLVVLAEGVRKKEPAELVSQVARAVTKHVGFAPGHVLILRAGHLPTTKNGKKRRHDAAQFVTAVREGRGARAGVVAARGDVTLRALTTQRGGVA